MLGVSVTCSNKQTFIGKIQSLDETAQVITKIISNYKNIFPAIFHFSIVRNLFTFLVGIFFNFHCFYVAKKSLLGKCALFISLFTFFLYLPFIFWINALLFNYMFFQGFGSINSIQRIQIIWINIPLNIP